MNSTSMEFDNVVIGGGTGGYVAAIRSAQLGLKTALVERNKLGGVCLHRGCIPTKVLLHSADVYSLIRRADEFGLGLDSASLTYDLAKMQAKVEKVVTQLYKGVDYLVKKKGVTVFKGHAIFNAPGAVEVQEWTGDGQPGPVIASLATSNLILATGSSWREMEGLPVDNQGAIINADGALHLAAMPKEIVIAGAGQTGVEFASFFSTFGAKVHLVEAGARVLPAEDAEVSAQVDRLLSRRGVQIYLNTSLQAGNVTQNEGGVEISLTVKDKPKKIQAEKLLVATGRVGNNQGLEKLPGLKIGPAGFIQTGPDCQAAPGVYAIGDLMGGFSFEDGPRYLLAHASFAQGIFVAEQLAGKQPDPVNYKAIPRCTYSQPQVASIGLTEQQARLAAVKAGKDEKTAVKIGKFPFKANGRALMLGETEGFVKIISDAQTGDLLGAHIVGPQATELIAEPSLAQLFDASAWELAQAARPHPALIETIMEAARDVDGWAIHM